MDREQERLQSLGFCGIFKESFKIFFTNWKIFIKLTLVLIVPLSFIFLVVIPNTGPHLFMILKYRDDLKSSLKGSTEYARISESIKSEWMSFLIFNAAFFTFYLFISLLSYCGVVYAVACTYRGTEGLSFKKVMGLLPKVWKRLFFTLLCYFVIVFGISAIAELLFFLTFNRMNLSVGVAALGIVLLVAYCLIMLYMSIIWQFATVVSVLEDLWGIKAAVKANALIKGKKLAAFGIFFILDFLLSCPAAIFEVLVFEGVISSLWGKIVTGILCFFLLVMVNLLGLILPTVLYCVCKSYHRETIVVQD